MTQYQDPDAPQRPPVAEKSTRDHGVDRQLRDLHVQIEKQADEIKILQQELRRLRNEVRSAVNAFNLRNHG